MITETQHLKTTVPEFVGQNIGRDCMVVYFSPKCQACTLLEPVWQAKYNGFENIAFVESFNHPHIKMVPSYEVFEWDSKRNKHKAVVNIRPVDLISNN